MRLIMTNSQQKFMTVKEAAREFPFSESSLRYLIFNGKSNGLNTCLRKIGKKILVNIADFERWIDAHKEVTK